MSKEKMTNEKNIELIKKIWSATDAGKPSRLIDSYKEQILTGNDGFITTIIHRQGIRASIEFDDHLQDGREGMLNALEKYIEHNREENPLPNFLTYAYTYIQGAVTRGGYRMGSVVNLTYGAAEKRVTISSLMRDYRILHSKEMPIEEVAKEMQMEPKSVRAILDTFGGAMDLDANTGDEEGTSLHEIIATDDADEFTMLNLDSDIVNTVLVDMEPLERFLVQIEFGLNGYPQMSIREAYKQFPEKMVKTLKSSGAVKPIGLSTAGLKAKTAREYFIQSYRELCGIQD